MSPDGVLVRYAEVGIKGQNRRGFIKRLADNAARALGEELLGLDIYSGRLWLYPKEVFSAAALARLARVPGVANYSQARRCDLTLESMQKTALELVTALTYTSFRVRSRRVFKEMALSSVDVDREVGAFLVTNKPAKVQMKGADLELGIDMLPQGAFVFVEKVRGPGGLPVGTGGTVVCLLSGGIDSPVAAQRMQRRGCKIVFVHFHSHPFLSRASAEKAVELAGVLAAQQGGAKLFLVPFGELQREIVETAPTALRVVLYRRFMVRLAGAIAARVGAKALVTGEALGQVASQTLQNMTVIDEAAPLTVLRPLVGFDKQEIINLAQAIGTYEISIQPDQDCCQLFVPKHPETYAQLVAVREAEAGLAVQRLCDETLARVEEVKLVGGPQ